MYCEEIDWAWRIRKAGWPIYTVPAAEVIHYGGASTGQVPARSVRNLWQSRAQLYEKHHAPWRRRAARKLAEYGLRRRAEQAENPALREAYEASVNRWQQVKL